MKERHAMRGPRLRVALLAGLAILGSVPAAAGIQVLEDVVYATHAGKELKLDLALPERPDANRPVVLMIHGGGWAAGDRRLYAATIRLLAERGFAAATTRAYSSSSREPRRGEEQAARGARPKAYMEYTARPSNKAMRRSSPRPMEFNLILTVNLRGLPAAGGDMLRRSASAINP